MSVRSGQSITKLFTTRRFDTGAATNADSLPTGTLYVNGTADAASVTVTNITTGVYKAAVTLPTLAIGDIVDLRVNATVNSVNDNAVIWTDTKDMALDSSGQVSVSDKTGFALTTSERNSIADAVLTRDVVNVEASANDHSLCYVVLAASEASASGLTLTVKRTDGTTTFATKTLTVDASASAVTGVS